MKDILRKCNIYLLEFLIHFFFRELRPFWLRNLAKMINTLYYWSEIVCQNNSSETFKQNVVKLCSWQGHTAHMHVDFHRKFSLIFFLREQLKLWPKYTIWNWFSMNDKGAVQSDIYLTVNIQMLHKCDNY